MQHRQTTRWSRRALLATGGPVLAVLALGACSGAPQPPPSLSKADVRVQMFDFLSTFAQTGAQRQAVLFMFADEKYWTYSYLGGREWKVLMPAQANGEQLLDEDAEWRFNESTRAVRPANNGAELILKALTRLGEGG